MLNQTEKNGAARRQGLGLLATAAVLLVLVGAWYFAASRAYERVRPGQPGISFAQFAQEMGPPERIGVFTHNGAQYVEWVGRPLPWYILPSGSPCYVFDSNGRVVDWTADDGDDPAFVTRWKGRQGWTATTVEAAKQRWP